MTPENDVLEGDCVEVMAGLDAESVDAIVTDPPYDLTSGKQGGSGMASLNPNSPAGRSRIGTGFMGKAWDGTGVAFRAATWAAALRVAKPGAHLLAFGGTRTYHRLACAIEDAGWEIRDCLVWAYASGFPKSLDVGKAIDKANGRKFEDRFALGRHIRERREASGLARAEVNAWFGYRDGCEHWERQDESGARVPTVADWGVLRVRLGLSDEWWPLVERAEADRERIGTNGNIVRAAASSQGFGKGSLNDAITAPATPDAEKWNGWGTALKPAWEPIILARKPLRGTVAANVLAHGTGALNIDGTRIGYVNEAPPDLEHWKQTSGGWKNTSVAGVVPNDNSKGRWPANVILTGDDEGRAIFDGDVPGVVGGGASASGGAILGDKEYADIGYHGDLTMRSRFDAYGDEGTYSRYFLIPKAARSDREPVLGGLPERVTKPYNGNLNNANHDYSDGAHRDAARRPARANVHPTVKPTELMRHLVRLVTPPGGLVLDPFLGSGTTALAAEMEGFRWLGIEKEPEYVAIARARLLGTQRGLGLSA